MVAARGNARGDCSEESGDIPGLGALRLPGPSAVGRGLETSCPARAGRKDGLIRPRAIFAARWVRNPGLGRFRAARETPGEKVRAPPAGTPPNPASLRPRSGPGSGHRERLRPRRLRTAPRSADAAPEPAGPRPMPRALAHHRRPRGVLGGPQSLGEGLPPTAGRAPAPSPRPRARPARQPENAIERGACAPGAGTAGGGGRADSGLRNARGPPGPSHLLREGRWALISPGSGRRDTCGSGAPAPLGSGGRTWSASWIKPDGRCQYEALHTPCDASES